MEKKRKGLVLVIVALIIIAIGVVFLISGNDKKHIVQFEGTEIENIEVLDGNYLKKPADPMKEGYTFAGWYLNGEPFDFTKPVEGNIKLEAKWEEEIKLTDEIYTITFDTDGGSKVESQNINGNGKVLKPADPTKKGYTFVEWQLDGAVYNFETLVTKSIELKAVWKEPGKVTITFDTDGGSSVKTQTVYADEKATKPTNPTKKGYKFLEWQVNGTTYDFSSKITSNVTLTAKWEKLETYTVTFNSDGGSNVGTKTVYEDSKVEKPTNPTKTGYIFVSWQLDGINYDFGKAITKNITLKATWREAKNLIVKFDSNGGSSVSNKSVVEGTKVGKPTNPTKSGYVFSAWQLNGKNYDFSKAVTGNITLKATWKANTYTIKVSIIDPHSPDVTLKVYENGKAISVSEIKYTDGILLCSGNNLTVNKSDIDEVTSLKVVLTGGNTVTAKIVK